MAYGSASQRTALPSGGEWPRPLAVVSLLVHDPTGVWRWLACALLADELV